MVELFEFSSQVCGREEASVIMHETFAECTASRPKTHLANDRYDGFLAEAEGDYIRARVASRPTWRSRTCVQVGRWLVAAGEWLKRAGGEPAMATQVETISAVRKG